jgi:hypothetical protein
VPNEQSPGRATNRIPRRWTDLVEDVVAWTLTVLSLLTVFTAVIVGTGTFGEIAEKLRAEASTRTLVTATVLESVPMLALEQPPSDVPARWIGPDGQPRTDIVTVAAGTNAGDEVPIWMDRSGARVPPPPTQFSAVGAGLLSGFSVLLAGGTVAGTVWLLVRRATVAANARRWGREWDTVGPRWTARGPH